MLVGISLLLLILGKRRGSVVLIASALSWLWVFSTPVTAEMLAHSLEQRYPFLSAEETQSADAAVILGGGAFRYERTWPYASIGGSVDRYIHGARLHSAARVHKIILSGAHDRESGPTEAQLGAEFLIELGIPPEHLILDNAARTTGGHVEGVARLLAEEELETFLLVTSAIHMRRAEAVFRAAGLEPVAVATDFQVSTEAPSSIRRFLPSVSALWLSTAAIHEYVGYGYYRIRGWI